MSILKSLSSLPTQATYAWLLRRTRVGTIQLDLANGKKLRAEGSQTGPTAALTIHRPTATLLRVIRGGGVGFAEAYLAGHWDTPDLATALETIARNLDVYVRDRKPNGALAFARRAWQRFTSRSRSEIPSIGDHYNLGNDFYTAWLDQTMTYSSAVYDGGDHSLSGAQIAKYRRLAQLADIKPTDHVLEIGCGWGGFAEYISTEIGASITGLTLSSEQADYARKRLAEAGVADRTEIKLQDFRDETGSYDKIVSIEMIESIPADLWPALFERISAVLRPEGKVAMQAITIDAKLFGSLLSRDDFISKHIFPGGALPSVEKVEELAADRGLQVTSATAFASSYAKTLQIWRDRFEEAWPSLTNLGLDERFRRTWRYYLAYCEAGFRTGRIDVHQFELVS